MGYNVSRASLRPLRTGYLSSTSARVPVFEMTNWMDYGWQALGSLTSDLFEGMRCLANVHGTPQLYVDALRIDAKRLPRGPHRVPERPQPVVPAVDRCQVRESPAGQQLDVGIGRCRPRVRVVVSQAWSAARTTSTFSRDIARAVSRPWKRRGSGRPQQTAADGSS